MHSHTEDTYTQILEISLLVYVVMNVNSSKRRKTELVKSSLYTHGRQKKSISELKMSKLEVDGLQALTSDHFASSRFLAKNRNLRLLWSQSHPNCSVKDWKDVTWSSCHSLATLLETPELLELKLTSSEQKKF